MSDKRKQGFFAALVADPWRKLLAIALAALSWYFVNSRINSETVRPSVPLVTVGEGGAPGLAIDRVAIALPTDRVVGLRFLDGERVIDKVDVVLKGPRFRIAEIQDQPLDLQITKFLSLDWNGRSGVEFTAADLRRDQFMLKDIRVELRPARIRLDVETIASRSFPLTLDAVELVEGPFERRLMRETARFTPEAPEVLGKAFGIDQLGKQGGKRFRATMTSGANDRQASAQIEIMDSTLGLRFKTQPLLTMQLKPITSPFLLEIPVVVDDIALPVALRGLWQPESKSRTVRILAGGDLRSRLVGLSENVDKSALPDWVSENLRLHVHIQRPSSGTILGPELDLKARLLLLGALHATVDRNECLLDEVVVVKLRRQT